MNAIINKVGSYMSMVKFSHTIFAMPFALVGFFYAIQTVDLPIADYLILLGQVVLCMVFARNAAMGFNRYIDKDIDSQNPRTATREIPAGMVKSKSALWFVIVNAVLFIATTAFINTMVLWLSPVALLVVLGYSLTKRITALCHLILGLGLSLAPIGAWLAVTGVFAWFPVSLSFAVLFWVSGFDIIYALQDEEFDKQQKLHSIPALMGKVNALWLSRALHVFSAAAIIIAAYFSHVGLLYGIGATVFIGLLIYQHLLVKPNDLSRVNLAFFTTNGVASVLFALLVIADLYLIRYPIW